MDKQTFEEMMVLLVQEIQISRLGGFCDEYKIITWWWNNTRIYYYEPYTFANIEKNKIAAIVLKFGRDLMIRHIRDTIVRLWNNIHMPTISNYWIPGTWECHCGDYVPIPAYMFEEGI